MSEIDMTYSGLVYHTKLLSIPFLKLLEIIEWCDKQFGFHNWEWVSDDQYGYCTFYFSHEEHITWFLMRWS